MACAFALGLAPSCEEPPAAIAPLLAKEWGQRGDYAAFSPVNAGSGEHERLGCWSVAFAQILFFHGLEPSGAVSYIGTYYAVSGDFDAPGVAMALVAPTLDASTPSGSKLETSRYLWYAALATGKDFGTGEYIGNSDVRRASIAEHYGVTTSRLSYPDGATRAEVERFMRDELAAGRPLLLYVESTLEGEEGFAHALVVDGIEGSGDAVRVHLNFGWAGVSDGWYPLWSPIATAYGVFDKDSRWVLAVRP
jgi:hypothetical protein